MEGGREEGGWNEMEGLHQCGGEGNQGMKETQCCGGRIWVCVNGQLHVTVDNKG